MAVMTMVAWERADESGGFSVARRERLEPPDAGWLFHGTEVLVGEQTLRARDELTPHFDGVS